MCVVDEIGRYFTVVRGSSSSNLWNSQDFLCFTKNYPKLNYISPFSTNFYIILAIYQVSVYISDTIKIFRNGYKKSLVYFLIQ